MREFNSKELDVLNFDNLKRKLKCLDEGNLLFKKHALLPEADILICSHKGKQFNVKFDLVYGVSLDLIDDFSENEIIDVIDLLRRHSNS